MVAAAPVTAFQLPTNNYSYRILQEDSASGSVTFFTFCCSVSASVLSIIVDEVSDRHNLLICIKQYVSFSRCDDLKWKNGKIRNGADNREHCHFPLHL